MEDKIKKIDEEIKKLLDERLKLYIALKGKEWKDIIFPEKNKESILSEINKICENIVKPKKIAYLGPEATFTHMAAKTKFGENAVYIPTKNIGEVFSHVETKRADYGVVPVENTNEGMVNYTLDKILDTELSIIGEVILKISHFLLSKEEDLRKIKRIYSHPQALAQCRLWIEKNFPNIETIETKSTGEAAYLASCEEKSAAIGSKLAKEMYDLKILREHIEDRAQNYTRFLIIGKEREKPTGNDKTSIVVAIKDKVGALFNLMKPFAENKVNMTKIESRPSKQKPWDYIFFIDMDGHIEEEKIKHTLKEVEAQTKFLRVLGSYPKAEKNY